MKRDLIYLLLSLALLPLSSCKESSIEVHKVKPEFEEYVQRFFAYAETYGVNISDKNLIMQYSSSLGNKAGVCYMNTKPIKIDINEEYWTTFTGTPLEDEIKEDLIFHEMAHGFLRRYHDNTVLNNGDWKTIMCGDELPNGRASNINYRGMRKEYYIKELFTQTTDAPSWSTYVPDFSTITESELIHATPENSKFWLLGDTEQYNGRITDGVYICSNKGENNIYSPLITEAGSSNIYDVLNDFYFEAQVKFTSSEVTTPSGGICFSNYNPQNHTISPMHFAIANKKNLFYIGENSCIAPFIYLYSELIDVEEYNKYAIRKHNDTLFYYINDKFIYHNDLQGLPLKGSSFGTIIGGHCDLYVKDIVIRTPEGVKNSVVTSSENVAPIDLGPNFATALKEK